MDAITDNVGVFKKAMHAPDFLDLRAADKVLSSINKYSVIVGHNRAATKGAITSRNAHPFSHDGVTCVHNGTIYNHTTLKGCSQFLVDSEAITYSIANNGIEETIKHINGAYALVYYDNNDKILRIIRNEERPLAVAFIKGKETMLIASEYKMLQWIADRNGLEIEKTLAPVPGTLYEFDLEKKLRKVKETKLDMYVPTSYTYNYDTRYSNYSYKNTVLKKLSLKQGDEVKFRVDEIVNTTTGGNVVTSTYCTIKGTFVGKSIGPFRKVVLTVYSVPLTEWGWLHNFKGTILTGNIVQGYEDNRIKNQVTITIDAKTLAVNGTKKKTTTSEKSTATYRGPSGLFITKAEWIKAAEDGCDSCTGPVYPVDHQKTGWTENEKPICKDCIKVNTELERYL